MKNYLILCLILLGACGPVYERGNGNLSTVEKEVSSFSEVEVDGQFQIILDEGKEKVTVLTDENLHKYINIFVEGDVLYIESTENIKSEEGIKIYINYEHLESLQLKGAPQLSAEQTIKTKELNIDVDGAALVELDLKVRDLEISISGAGLIELSGEATDLILEMGGTGNLNAYKLMTENANIELSGVGAAQVNVSKRLIGSVSGVGSIKYKGNPKAVDTEINGLGQISPSSDKEEDSNIEIDL